MPRLLVALMVLCVVPTIPAQARPNNPCVTSPEARAVKTGMSAKKVQRIVGGKGVVDSRQGVRTTRHYFWCGAAPKYLAVTFKKNRAVDVRRVRYGQPVTDIDADGVADIVTFADLDGNTTMDASVDLGSDGVSEIYGYDTDGDGRFDTLIVTGAGGSAGLVDANKDGYMEVVALDLNADSLWERWLYDSDSDGDYDYVQLDSNGDGAADTWQQAVTATARSAEEIVTSNIVTLNQLGRMYSQSNPWVGSYYSRPAYWAQPPNRLP